MLKSSPTPAFEWNICNSIQVSILSNPNWRVNTTDSDVTVPSRLRIFSLPMTITHRLPSYIETAPIILSQSSYKKSYVILPTFNNNESGGLQAYFLLDLLYSYRLIEGSI